MSYMASISVWLAAGTSTAQMSSSRGGSSGDEKAEALAEVSKLASRSEASKNGTAPCEGLPDNVSVGPKRGGNRGGRCGGTFLAAGLPGWDYPAWSG